MITIILYIIYMCNTGIACIVFTCKFRFGWISWLIDQGGTCLHHPWNIDEATGQIPFAEMIFQRPFWGSVPASTTPARRARLYHLSINCIPVLLMWFPFFYSVDQCQQMDHLLISSPLLVLHIPILICRIEKIFAGLIMSSHYPLVN